MKRKLSELNKRNQLLYFFGWYNFMCAAICMLLLCIDNTEILGISRWIKPMKFFLSVGIMVWTMGWIMYYLNAKRSVRIYSWLILVFMFIENFIITLQSARGTTSHFNGTSQINIMLFAIMGVSILLFTLTIIFVLLLFLKQKIFAISPSYLWSIRLGVLFFIIFSVEGGMMLANNGHTVGGLDDSKGLPIINWSRQYGDLRIAHFFGMHALQLLPLAGCYLNKKQVIIFAILYFLIVSALFLEAMSKTPFIG